MVGILAAVISDGLDAVEAACAEALAEGAVSRDVVLNFLTRRRQPPAPDAIATPEALQLRHEPLAACAPYDSLRRPPGPARDSGHHARPEHLWHAPAICRGDSRHRP